MRVTLYGSQGSNRVRKTFDIEEYEYFELKKELNSKNVFFSVDKGHKEAINDNQLSFDFKFKHTEMKTI